MPLEKHSLSRDYKSSSRDPLDKIYMFWEKAQLNYKRRL